MYEVVYRLASWMKIRDGATYGRRHFGAVRRVLDARKNFKIRPILMITT
jgi:hypothetical protein